MDTVTALVAILGGQAALLLAGGWLVKTLMTQALAKQLEQFKTELTRENALTIERFKHDLQLQASQKQTVFTRIHEVRMEAVAKMYASLLTLADACTALTHDDIEFKSVEWLRRYESARDSMRALRSDIRSLKIYLPKSAAEQLVSVADRIESLLVAVAANTPAADYSTHWHRFDTQLKNMMPIATRVLEIEFQTLLGIERDA